MVEEMRLLVIGLLAGAEPGTEGNWVCASGRERGLAAGMYRCGWEVMCLAPSDGISGALHLVDADSARDAGFDAALIISRTSWRHVEDLGWKHIAKVPCAIHAGDYGDGRPEIGLWGYLSPHLVGRHITNGRTEPAVWAPWGISPIHGVALSPYPKVRPGKTWRAILCGRIGVRAVRWLCRMAERTEFEPWFAGTNTAGEPLDFYAEARMRRTGVRFIADLEPGRSIGQAVEWGAHFRWLAHADVAIALNECGGWNDVVSSKLYDYLAAGAPVVCEEGFPNSHDPESIGAGVVVQMDDYGAFVRAMRALSRRRPNSDRTRARAVGLGTWDRTAAIFDSWFRRSLG